MKNYYSFLPKLYEVNEGTFDDIALELFRFQAENNIVYNTFLRNLKVDPATIVRSTDIPFLPVSFFKRHAIQTTVWSPELVFTSSGTTGAATSRHLVPDVEFYRTHSKRCFEYHFGPLENYHFLALLPSYLEREGSSLICMMDYFIRESHSPHSGFFLHDLDVLAQKLQDLRETGKKVVLWGVTFALLELAETFPGDYSHCMVMETGGMKGRRKEITRTELHEILRLKLGVPRVYSEYGMTELMSQAYTQGGTTYTNPPFMRTVVRDPADPMAKGLVNETGAINIIDLANWHSMAFIETEDMGKVFNDGTFEVLGRMDNSDIRGCNLLI